MVYYSIHCHLIERRFDEAREDIRNDYSGKMVREKHGKNLPLHIALQVGAPYNIIFELYRAYPVAAHMKSSKGNTAIELATARCRPKARKILMSICRRGSRRSSGTFTRTCIQRHGSSLQHTPKMTSCHENKSVSTVSCDLSSSYQHPSNVTTAKTSKSDERTKTKLRASSLLALLESMET